MKSRISFFDKTVLRKDITRFSPLWLIYFIGGTLVMLMLAIDNRPETLARGLGTCIGVFGWINMVYALLAAQLLFGDLYNSRLCNALHAMPLRRETWFASHLVSGLLFSLVPNAVGILVTLPVLGKYWYSAFFWLLGMEMHYLFFFGLAVFCVMCTGSRFAGVAIYGILNFLVLIVQWMLETIYLPMLYGVVADMELLFQFCPVINLMALNDEYLVFEWVSDGVSSKSDLRFLRLGDPFWYLAIIMALGIVFGAAALVLYRRRKLESAGDFMAVSWLKPVFAVVSTLCVGSVFAMVGQVFGDSYLVFLIVGLVVGWFGSQMLLQRTVKVFRPGVFARFGVLAVAILISIGLTKLDPLGITRYVPDIRQVQEVSVDAGFRNVSVSSKDAVRLQQVLDIHSQIARNGEPDDGVDTISIDLHYTLADGQTLSRSYRAHLDSKLYESLRSFLTTPESVLGYEDWDAFRTRIAWVEVGGNREISHSAVSPDRIDALLEAIRADCNAGTMAQGWHFHENEEQVYYISLQVRDGGLDLYWDVQIFESNINTIRWIEENMKPEL